MRGILYRYTTRQFIALYFKPLLEAPTRLPQFLRGLPVCKGMHFLGGVRSDQGKSFYSGSCAGVFGSQNGACDFGIGGAHPYSSLCSRFGAWL